MNEWGSTSAIEEKEEEKVRVRDCRVISVTVKRCCLVRRKI